MGEAHVGKDQIVQLTMETIHNGGIKRDILTQE